MKKRIVAFAMAFLMLASAPGTALAVENGAIGNGSIEITPFASKYLNSYTVVLAAKGSGKMNVSMSVDGTGVMDKIGVMEIEIDYLKNGTWYYWGSLDSVEHPEFYSYNSRDYVGDASFTGTPGVTYYVTLTVYAKKGTGSDTGYVTSPAVVCK